MKRQYTLTVSYKTSYGILSYELSSIEVQFIGLQGLHGAMDACYTIIKGIPNSEIYSVKVNTTTIFGQYGRY